MRSTTPFHVILSTVCPQLGSHFNINICGNWHHHRIRVHTTPRLAGTTLIKRQVSFSTIFQAVFLWNCTISIRHFFKSLFWENKKGIAQQNIRNIDVLTFTKLTWMNFIPIKLLLHTNLLSKVRRWKCRNKAAFTHFSSQELKVLRNFHEHRK